MVQEASIIALMYVARETDVISLISEQLIGDELNQGVLHCIDIHNYVAPRIFGNDAHLVRKLSKRGNLFCDLATEALLKFLSKN